MLIKIDSDYVTVSNIRELHSLNNVEHNMFAVIKDINNNTTLYRFNEKSGWVITVENYKYDFTFVKEKYAITSNEILLTNIPMNNLVWDVKIFQGNVLIKELDVSDIIVAETILSGLNEYVNMDIYISYIYIKPTIDILSKLNIQKKFLQDQIDVLDPEMDTSSFATKDDLDAVIVTITDISEAVTDISIASIDGLEDALTSKVNVDEFNTVLTTLDEAMADKLDTTTFTDVTAIINETLESKVNIETFNDTTATLLTIEDFNTTLETLITDESLASSLEDLVTTEDFNTALDLKADSAFVTDELDKKVNTSDLQDQLDLKFNITDANDALDLKSDKTYVDETFILKEELEPIKLLNRIKEVDGIDSGLDSDLLRGISTYLTTDNFLHIQDSKLDEDGGDAIEGRQVRNLNDVLTNTITDASLDTNVMTLPIGTYYLEASATVMYIKSHKLFLYDKTNDNDILIGINGYNYSSRNNDRGIISGVFTLTDITELELSQYIEKERDDYGLGRKSKDSSTPSIYTDVKIWKVN